MPILPPGESNFMLLAVVRTMLPVVDDGPAVNRHKPSVEVTLFKSAAAGWWAKLQLGIMLTGMGNDGAAAMREMKDAGSSLSSVQDEAELHRLGHAPERRLHMARLTKSYP